MARGEGLRVRIASIPGETPKTVLRAPLYFPVLLNGFGWTETFSHTEYDTVRGGEFSQPAMGPATARKLRDTDDMETLTMSWEPSWLVEAGVEPDDVYDVLFGVGRSRKPVELLVAPKLGERPLLRMPITIRSIAIQMRKGEPDTLYYVVRAKEWRNASAERKGAGAPNLPTTHKLTASDSLHSLSTLYYKTATEWKAIAAANAIRGIGQSTKLVTMKRFKVGSKIKIPEIRAIRVGAGITSKPGPGDSSIPGLS